MKKYLVTYDLVGTDESSADYKRLIEKVNSYPWWGKIQKSAWIIRADESPAVIRDAFLAEMNSNDRLFVAGLTGETAWRNVLCDEQKLKTALAS